MRRILYRDSVRKYRKVYLCIVIIVILLCVLPIKTMVVHFAFQYHLTSMGIGDHYKQGDIVYYNTDGFHHSGYTMQLKGDGVYDTYQNAIKKRRK